MQTFPSPATTPAAEPLEPRRLLAADPSAGLLAPLSAGTAGPLSLNTFAPDGRGGFDVGGSVALPGGDTLPFDTTATVTPRAAGEAGVSVLDVRLGAVDLDLLGLRLDLAPVALELSASTGEGMILGNLLAGLLRADPSAGSAAVGGLVGDAVGHALAGAGRVQADLPIGDAVAAAGLDERLGLARLATTGEAGVPDDLPGGPTGGLIGGAGDLPGEVRVLGLSIEELDLNVLGLRLRTLEPVDLSVRATSGPGKILGNLFVGISTLLDPLLPEQPDAPAATRGGGDAPSSLDLMGDNEVPIVGLELEDVDLYLLGLQADLSVDLLVAVEGGAGNLLGNVLLRELASLQEQIDSGDLAPVDRVLDLLLDGRLDAAMPAARPDTPLAGGTDGPPAAATKLAAADATPRRAVAAAPADPPPLRLLNLSIDSLDVGLAGLSIRSQGVSLELAADPGPGALLGNLLARLTGGLDAPTPTPALDPNPADPAPTPRRLVAEERPDGYAIRPAATSLFPARDEPDTATAMGPIYLA